MTTGPVRALLVGSGGRMGQAVLAAAKNPAQIEIASCCERGESVESKIANAQVVIDFSSVEGTAHALAACLQRKVPLVIGTTGHSRETRVAIESASTQLPIVLAANFSVGVTVLLWLARKTTELLGPEYDVEIVEMHHRHKKDAPSGTANRLAQTIRDARGITEDTSRHGRVGVGLRSGNEIGVHALRGGDVVGDHMVSFAGAGERLELTHRAATREVFALGALRAARWIVDKPPGLYGMAEVLDLPA